MLFNCQISGLLVVHCVVADLQTLRDGRVADPAVHGLMTNVAGHGVAENGHLDLRGPVLLPEADDLNDHLLVGLVVHRGVIPIISVVHLRFLLSRSMTRLNQD